MSENLQINNILYNEAAMSVLREAVKKLEALGVHVQLSPSDLEHGDMSIALHAALTDEAVVNSHCQTVLGSELVNSELARFVSIKEDFLSGREALLSLEN